MYLSLTSPFLNGIDVPEQQQNLPRSALLCLHPVREEQVVAGDAQGASARRVERLTEHNILHIGGLDVLRKLHLVPVGDAKPPPRHFNLDSTSDRFLGPFWSRRD